MKCFHTCLQRVHMQLSASFSFCLTGFHHVPNTNVHLLQNKTLMCSSVTLGPFTLQTFTLQTTRLGAFRNLHCQVSSQPLSDISPAICLHLVSLKVEAT